jgi:hypothetical protein
MVARIMRFQEGSMTIPAARVLAFPGIDLETLARLRAVACEAFMRDDLSAYQDACTMMRKLIGGQDVSETGAGSYRPGEKRERRHPLSQEARGRLSAKLLERSAKRQAMGIAGRWQPW